MPSPRCPPLHAPMPACSAVRESAGAAQITTVLLGSAALLLVTWISTYASPYGTFLRASCLVLNSTQTLLPKGFNREPLYRAEVYVYVFNTTFPECCCEDIFGRQRCAEWEGLAFDNMQVHPTPPALHPSVHSTGQLTAHACRRRRTRPGRRRSSSGCTASLEPTTSAGTRRAR
jgi:hypothetical protein